MNAQEKLAVQVTHRAIKRTGSNAQRFVNAGHSLVHRGNNEFRCVKCNVIASSESDRTELDVRCSKAK